MMEALGTWEVAVFCPQLNSAHKTTVANSL